MATQYFSQFPMMYYMFDNKTATLVTNFMARVAISQQLLTDVQLYSPYELVDGETPEIVADKMYGDSTLHWVILLTNQIVDPRYDWYLSQNILYLYVQKKYGTSPEQVYGIHHYQDPVTGLVVDSTYPGAVSVTNYDYENTINEAKRWIRILNPSLISEFKNEFQSAMTG